MTGRTEEVCDRLGTGGIVHKQGDWACRRGVRLFGHAVIVYKVGSLVH